MPNETNPLMDNGPRLTAEAIEEFWKCTVLTYRASTTTWAQVNPTIMRDWHATYVHKMTPIFEAFIDKLMLLLNEPPTP